MPNMSLRTVIVQVLVLFSSCFISELDAQSVNIYGLRDVTLNNIRTQLGVRDAQSLCVFSDIVGNGYSVTAQGSGNNGAFSLASSSSSELLYSIEWNDQPGQTSGAELSIGVPLGLQSTSANQSACASGTLQSASLILVISPSDLSAASSGVNYSGTLSLTIAPQ